MASGYYAYVGQSISDRANDLEIEIRSSTDGIDGYTSNKTAIFKTGQYRTASTSFVGEVVYFAPNDTNVCAVLPCNTGDKIYVDVYGGAGHQRAYIFADADKKVISIANVNVHQNTVLTAPTNAKYVFFNNVLASKADGYYAYNGKTLADRINDLNTYAKITDVAKIATIQPGKNIFNPAVGETGVIASDGSIMTHGSYEYYLTSDFIQTEEGEVFSLSTWRNGSQSKAHKYFLFFNSSKEPISGSYTDNTQYIGHATAPENAAYIRVSTQYNGGETLIQLERGEYGTYYVPYEETTVLNSTTGLTTTMEKDVLSLVEGAGDILSAFTNITCIGDSLTASQVWTSASSNRQAYTTYPQAIAKRTGANVSNVSTSGASASSWWSAHNSEIVSKTNQLTIIYLGTNGGLTDTIDTDCSGDDYTQWADTNTGNYGKIIAKSIAVGSRVVLIKCRAGSNYWVTNDVIQQFAEKFNTAFIQDEEMPDMKYHYYPDGTGYNNLHYNDFGYQIFADQVIRKISALDTDLMKRIIPA